MNCHDCENNELNYCPNPYKKGTVRINKQLKLLLDNHALCRTYKNAICDILDNFSRDLLCGEKKTFKQETLLYSYKKAILD